MKKNKVFIEFVIKVLQGSLIGVGAVLPGISGGVLCVVFGIYKTVMELLAEPFKNFKTHVPKLLPIILGVIIGFLGIANILSVFLEKYPSQSICVFIGLIGGMIPSLFKEARKQGKNKTSLFSLLIAMQLTFILLISLKIFSVEIAPNFKWYLFCGFCLALSIIAPGMSFSTLLMPLGLYEPFIDGIGNMRLNVVMPGGIGAVLTLIVLSKAVNFLFDRYYSVAFHGIIGIVIAATIMIIPFTSFTITVAGLIINIICISAGVFFSKMLDEFNQKHISYNL